MVQEKCAWSIRLYPQGIDKDQSLERLLTYTRGRSARWMNENPLNPDVIIKFRGDIFDKGYYEIIKLFLKKVCLFLW